MRSENTVSADLSFRGLVKQVSDVQLVARMDQERFTCYAGFDPSAASLQVGNLVPLLLLRRLQELGHRPIVLLGGGTGLIGDPSGKSSERPLPDREQHDANIRAIAKQVSRFVEVDGARTAPPASGEEGSAGLVLDNAEWLAPMGLIEFLRETGKHFTVNQMMAKESVHARLARPEQGISFTEFAYMLLQAYDFLHLYEEQGCRLQVGASDQWGNITMGVDLVRRVHGEAAYGLTTPLATNPDGTKLGKTETGTVWLDAARTSPYELYQFFLRSDDTVVGQYLRWFTFLDHDTIRDLDQRAQEAPERREAQRRLAFEVCRIVHGTDEAKLAAGAAAALFSDDLRLLDEDQLLTALEGAPTSTKPASVLQAPGWPVVDAFVSSGLAPSKTAVRRLIAQGGCSVNGEIVSDADRSLLREDLLFGAYVVLRKGRKDYHLLRFQR